MRSGNKFTRIQNMMKIFELKFAQKLRMILHWVKLEDATRFG